MTTLETSYKYLKIQTRHGKCPRHQEFLQQERNMSRGARCTGCPVYRDTTRRCLVALHTRAIAFRRIVSRWLVPGQQQQLLAWACLNRTRYGSLRPMSERSALVDLQAIRCASQWQRKTLKLALGQTRWRYELDFDVLPAEPTVIVRSHIPGRVAILICSLPLKTMQSYCKLKHTFFFSQDRPARTGNKDSGPLRRPRLGYCVR